MKKIQKGFTLVELIVVMAIMGVIMAVIMSIIGPTSRIASRVESMKDEETAAIQVGRAVKNELSYATKVWIESINDGDPIPVPSNGNYKYVYEIDNVNPRASSAKGAKGIITLGTWSGTAIQNKAVVMQEPTWGEEEFNMTIDEFGAQDKNYYVMLGFHAHRMKAVGGAYVADTDSEYTYNESITFINVNNKDVVKKGGNTNADDFSVTIKDQSLATKKDKIYIFFNVAQDTPLSIGGGAMFSTTAGTGSTASTGGSGSGSASASGSSSGGGGSTSAGNVIFHMSDGSSKSVALDAVGHPTEIPADENTGSSPNQNTEDTEYVFAGWSASTGTFVEADKITTSSVLAANTSIYAHYYVFNKYAVVYHNYDGSELSTERVSEGDVPVGPSSVPAPPEDDQVFDKWVPYNSGTPEFGQPITSESHYIAQKCEAKGLVTVHFLSPLNGAIELQPEFVNGSGGYNNSPATFNIQKGVSYIATADMQIGHTLWARVTGMTDDYTDKLGIILYAVPGDRNNFYTYYQAVKPNSFTSKDLYYYVQNDGSMHLEESAPSLNETVVNFHVIDAPADDIVNVSNGSGLCLLQYNEANGVSYSVIQNQSKNITVVDGTSYVFRTNAVLKVNNNASTCSINNNGGVVDVYIYKDINGDLKISTSAPPTTTTFTISFLSDLEGTKINANAPSGTLTAGSTKVNLANVNVPFGTVNFKKGDKLAMRFDTEVKFTVDNVNTTIPNDGGNYVSWYYNKQLYGKEEDAVKAYEEDQKEAGAHSVTIHFLCNPDQYNNFIAVKGKGVKVTTSHGSQTDAEEYNYNAHFCNSQCFSGNDVTFSVSGDCSLQICGKNSLTFDCVKNMELYCYKAGDSYIISEIAPEIANVTIHWDANHRSTNSDRNIGTDQFIRINGSPDWVDDGKQEDVVYASVLGGESLTIQIVTGWSKVSAEASFSYNELVSGNITDLYVSNGQISTTPF